MLCKFTVVAQILWKQSVAITLNMLRWKGFPGFILLSFKYVCVKLGLIVWHKMVNFIKPGE
jgi:hypothetical protein